MLRIGTRSCTGGRPRFWNTTRIWIGFVRTCARQRCATTRQTPSTTSCCSDACGASRRSQNGIHWPRSSSRVGASAKTVRTSRNLNLYSVPFTTLVHTLYICLLYSPSCSLTVITAQDSRVRVEWKPMVARIGASCMWALGQWDRDHFEAYMSELPRDTYDGLFFRAVHSIHLGEHESSQTFIRQARDILGARALPTAYACRPSPT